MSRRLKHIILSLLCCLLIHTSVQAQRDHALLVGISNYPEGNGWSAINGATDVHILEKVLKGKGFEVTTLIDEAATYDRIIEELARHVKGAQTGDGIYLHFSCHGQPYEDADGDEADGWDEAIVPYDAPVIYQSGKYEGEKHLTDDKLNEYLNALRQKTGKTGYVITVIDACHAGTSYRGDDDAPVRGTSRGFSSQGRLYRPLKLEKENTYHIANEPGLSPITILEACRPYQQNREIKEDGHYVGALSWYVSRQISQAENWRNSFWIKKVEQAMNGDIRLTQQNLVIETSH